MFFIKEYFSLVYGPKFTAFNKIVQIYSILNKIVAEGITSATYNILCLELVELVYSMSPAANAIRSISLKDKLIALIPIYTITSFPQFYIGDYPDNLLPITFKFIFGFFIGDGSFYVRLRNSSTEFRFVPI